MTLVIHLPILILLFSHHNRLGVLYLQCTRGYLQSYMLVAVVSVRVNNCYPKFGMTGKGMDRRIIVSRITPNID